MHSFGSSSRTYVHFDIEDKLNIEDKLQEKDLNLYQCYKYKDKELLASTSLSWYLFAFVFKDLQVNVSKRLKGLKTSR